MYVNIQINNTYLNIVNTKECACQRKLLEFVSNINVRINFDISLLSTNACTFLINATHCTSSEELDVLPSSGEFADDVFDVYIYKYLMIYSIF